MCGEQMFCVKTGKIQAAQNLSILVFGYKIKFGLTCKFIDKSFKLNCYQQNVKNFEMSLINDIIPTLYFIIT